MRLENNYFQELLMINSFKFISIFFALIRHVPIFLSYLSVRPLFTDLSTSFPFLCISALLCTPHSYLTRAIDVFCFRLNSLPYAVCFCTLHTLYWHFNVPQTRVKPLSCNYNPVNVFSMQKSGIAVFIMLTSVIVYLKVTDCQQSFEEK